MGTRFACSAPKLKLQTEFIRSETVDMTVCEVGCELRARPHSLGACLLDSIELVEGVGVRSAALHPREHVEGGRNAYHRKRCRIRGLEREVELQFAPLD